MRAARRGDQGSPHDSSSDAGSPAIQRGAVGSPSDPPLPEGWKKLYSRTKDREYYQNVNTGKSQWQPPTIDFPMGHPPSLEEAAVSGALQQHQQHGQDGDNNDGGGKSAATIRMQQDAVPDEGSKGWRKRALEAEARVESLSSEMRYINSVTARVRHTRIHA